MSNQPTNASIRLIVSRRNVGQLGTVTFDKSNQPTLTTEGTHPAVEELKKAWQEISQKEKLSFVQSTPEVRDGRTITGIDEFEVGRDDPNYYYAVLDTLSRKYGFSVDIAK